MKKQAEDIMKIHDELAEVKSEHTNGKVPSQELPI